MRPIDQIRELEILRAALLFVELDAGEGVADLRRKMVAEVDERIEHWRIEGTRDVPPASVHHLHQGVTACVMSAFYRLPKDWPEGHRWSADWSDVTCIACLLHAPGPL